ncbi:MAG: secretin N-terminal domain-containing protein, partial [Hyphomicrobiaceae bacterium]
MNTVQGHFMARAIACFVLLVSLAGCAGQQMHRDGLALMAKGQAEEGLAKLSEAARAAPDNLRYRADLLRNRLQTVERMMSTANAEREAGHRDAAKALYETILRINPGNTRAILGLEALDMDKRHDVAISQAETLLKKHDLAGADDALKPVLLEDPKNARAQALKSQIDEQEAKEAMTAPSLKATFSKPVTLQFRDANLKMVFEALSRTSGINVLLDKDVRPDLKTSLFVKDVSVEDVIDLILLQNQLEKKVISDNTVFIYPSTPAKLKDYQDLQIRSFHLVNADPKQILDMLKTLLKTKDIYIDEKTNSIVMRDTPDAIRLAEKLVADQDVPAPEVMLEVEVLEVSRSRASELGINYPQTFSVVTPASVVTLRDLKNLSGGDLKVTPLGATLNLMLEDTDTQILASPRIRVRNREKAKIMIGSRLPVITNAVTPVSTGTPVITGSVQYLDVGLKLEVEPDIHLDNEVVIKLGLEVSSLVKAVENAQSGTTAYEVGTRNATTVLRLKDGETQILGGLINDQDTHTAQKIPGLGQIPILGRLFSDHKKDKSKSEIILSITPHVVGSATLPDARNEEFWSGSESTVRDGLLDIKPVGSVALSSSESASPYARQTQQHRGAPTASTPVAADLPLTLSWQGPARVKHGDKLILTLDGKSQQEVESMGMRVHFDPAVFKADDVVEGDFIKPLGGGHPTLTKTINQSAGQIVLNLASGGKAGPSGEGIVATLVLEAIADHAQS